MIDYFFVSENLKTANRSQHVKDGSFPGLWALFHGS